MGSVGPLDAIHSCIVKRPRRTRIVALAVALAALSAMWCARPVQIGVALPPETPVPAGLITSAQPDTRLAFSLPYGERRVYPYSVIPSGIASVDSLRSIVEHNPEIARHLRDFDLQHAKVVHVTEPRAVYVSYRIGSNIFWTTKRLTLAKGESLVTDGTRTLRGRCGNDVSDAAVEPTSEEEPPIAELDTPLSLPQVDADSELDLAPLPMLASVPPDSTFTGGPTLFVPPVGSSSGSTSTPPTDSGSPPSSPPPPFIFPPFGPPGSSVPVPSTPPVSTPEPSTLLLMLFGAAGVGIRRFWGKRR